MGNNRFFSKKFLEKIIEGINEAIVVVNKEGIIKLYNEKFQSIVNLSKNSIINSNIEVILPGLRNINTKDYYNYKISKLNKNVIVNKQIFKEDNETFFIYLITENHFNIELANKYTEVNFRKDIYENILDSIDEGVHIADANGNLIYINDAQEKLDGYNSKKEVLGKHVCDVYQLDENTSLLLKVQKEKKPLFDVHQEYISKSGKYVSCVCSTVPLFFDDKIVASAAIVRDFSKFKNIAHNILNLEKNINFKKDKSEFFKNKYSFNDILGNSKNITETIMWGKAASKSQSPVLIFGETGTGKEMFAQSIHGDSNRAKNPFIAINCAAIPESLLEGILFGTVKGIFTGAMDRKGLIEQAEGGTLFLDEINSMPISLQSKILRVIEEKKVMRLGGKKEMPINVRIISSCNVEPSKAIEKGEMRDDLFYRLAVLYIIVPPLRERLSDLDILINYFINYFNKKMGKNVKGVSERVLNKFKSYDWPGNVRQLKHCIECAMNLVSDENNIDIDQIPKYLKLFKSNSNNGDKISNELKTENFNIINQIQEQEKDDIIKVIQRNRGNVAKAAKELGMSRQNLHYRLKKYNLK